MLAVFVVGYGLGVLLSVVNGNLTADTAAFTLAFAAFMTMGSLIVAHRPGNAVGWIFSAVGLLAATGLLAMEYAAYAYLTRPGSLPGAALAAWYASWFWYPMFGLITLFIPLVFPTGRLLSARWRPVAGVAAVATMTLVVLSAIEPTLTLQDTDYTVDNPIGLAGIEDPEQSTLGAIVFLLFLGCILPAVFSMVLRFRRSRGVERQQLKWLTYSGGLLLLWVLVTLLLVPNAALPTPVWLDVALGLLFALVPIAAGIAVLRYRLYDIDRLINRTLVYGLLTVLLAGVYAGAVLVLGQLFGGVTGDPPSWAVAGATLAVAALFQPARRRIQAVVDRRFNRRKYHAAQTIQAYSTRLRDQIDLDTLSTELLAVVDQTMEPTQITLWLRPYSAGSSGTAPSRARPTTWTY
jgi:hypothetical protein